MNTLHQAHANGEAARLALLYDVSRSFSELIELDDLIPFVVTKTKEILSAESCAILLLDEAAQELYFPYSSDVDRNVEDRLAKVRLPASQGIAGWVLQQGSPQLVPDVSKDPRWYGRVDQQSGMATYSLLCAPLQTRRGRLGVIELRNRLDGAFTAEDLGFLHTLAGSIAVAIDNAQLYGERKASESRLRDEVALLHREVASINRFVEIVGVSPAIEGVFQLMESAIGAPVTVLLHGETGTGKEIIARAIHYHGPRKEKPFVAVNCAALTETLLESELFGYRRGAFTGAFTDRKGLFESANGGTIFLDEVGDMPPPMQVKVLRVLERGEILPVGENTSRCVDVRIISATIRDLEKDTKEGRFREDLYYRLNAFPITVPPLRDRKDDIPLLAAHLLREISVRFEKPVAGLNGEVLDLFAAYAWPGNVRELKNEIERAVTLVGSGQQIESTHLSARLTPKGPNRPHPGIEPISLKRARNAFEAEYLTDVLRQVGGNASKAAKILGMSRVNLHRKMKSYGLQTRAKSSRRAAS